MSNAASKDDLTTMTFDEIAAKYGEETAINAGIAADPDAWELTKDDFAQMRPASEVHPEFVKRWRRTRGKQKAPTKEHISIRLDADLAAHFRASGPGWQTRLNDTLRRAVFGESG
ncbi:MAG: BrnA antitoxin family protein [Chloroflexota bacterium]|nr:BrnA antitoxin family protein [Chloroflexota bacterium]